MKSRVLLITFIIFSFSKLWAQYDSVHYIPPLFSISGKSSEIGEHNLYLSTNESSSFNVTIKESDGTLLGVKTISLSSPDSLALGDGLSAVNIIDSAQLNKALTKEGLILTASKPFFANIRQKSASQGLSLTAKGLSALGKRFRTGHLFSIATGNKDSLKSHMISVMATEPGLTTVSFSDISDGVIFYGTDTINSTTKPITVTLNQNECYVIGSLLEDPIGANDTLLNGILVTSDKDIVVNSGSLNGGSTGQSRDVGADQIVSVEKVGTEYVLIKGIGSKPELTEKVLVIADLDSTFLYINGNTTAYDTLNAGEFKFIHHANYDANGIMNLVSSKKLFVYHTTNSNPSGANGMGLNFIPPISCSGTQEVTVSHIDFFGGDSISMNIISKVGSTVSVNGGAIALPSAIPVTGNPNWEVYSLDIKFVITSTVNVVSTDIMNLSVASLNGAIGAAGYFSGFSQPKVADVAIQSISGQKEIIEGCEPFVAIFGKGGEKLNEELTFYFSIAGTAINGVDYTTIPDSVTIPIGKDKDTLLISAFADSEVEGDELVIFTITAFNECGDTTSVADTLTLKDYPTMTTTVSEGKNICDEFGETATVKVTVANGIPPYSYSWNNSSSTIDSAVVSPANKTGYIATITDKCDVSVSSDTIFVSVHCPLSAPNVFTPNGDGVNDVLVFNNLDQYFGSHLIVYNRFGGIVYENKRYYNDWKATDLSDGVYFYKLIPPPDNFNPPLSFPLEVLTGYIHIIR